MANIERIKKAYTKKARFEKATRDLDGILQGITADGIVNDDEVNSLKIWLDRNSEFCHLHPLRGAFYLIAKILEDGQVDASELTELKGLSNEIQTSYFNSVTADLQTLFGFVGGIMADRVLNEIERKAFVNWLADREHLRGHWPYDELFSASITANQESIRPRLHALLNQFSSLSGELTINMKALGTVASACSVDPVLEISGRAFCFTGESSRWRRDELVSFVEARMGRVTDSVSRNTDYLIVCADGSASWAFTTYGRKIESAFGLRQKGHKVVIVQEVDFIDHLRDVGLVA